MAGNTSFLGTIVWNGKLSSCMTCIKARQFGNFFISIYLYLIILILLLQMVSSFDLKHGNEKNYNLCEKCKIVVNSFQEGLRRTSRGKHEGGDAYWEEKKLNNYANSEIRLAEIQESLCHEISSGKDQCHGFAEEFESEIEEWFFQEIKKERQEQKEEGSTLFEYLCNGLVKACCPDGHFGPDCVPCLGYPNDICYSRGYCYGNGTRDGNGHCVCFKQYSGQNCDQCAKNYFSSGIVEKTIGQKTVQLPENCDRCDHSCASSCHSNGPKGCHVCRKGYNWDHENGCVDVNECSELETNPCQENTYCANTAGSFKCYQCHKACKGCVASGDESCIECFDGYQMTGGKCVPKEDHWYYSWSRYITYFCLAITTVIISRSSHLIGWIIGILTTLYITIYEMEFNQGSLISSFLNKIHQLVNSW